MIQFLQNGIAPIFVRDFSQRQQQQSRAVGTERGTIVNLPLILAEKVAFLSESTDTFVISSNIANIWTFYFTELENLSNFNTLTTAEILSGKNALAWVSMVLYLKKINENKTLKQKKNHGSCLEVTC